MIASHSSISPDTSCNSQCWLCQGTNRNVAHQCGQMPHKVNGDLFKILEILCVPYRKNSLHPVIRQTITPPCHGLHPCHGQPKVVSGITGLTGASRPAQGAPLFPEGDNRSHSLISRESLHGVLASASG